MYNGERKWVTERWYSFAAAWPLPPTFGSQKYIPDTSRSFASFHRTSWDNPSLSRESFNEPHIYLCCFEALTALIWMLTWTHDHWRRMLDGEDGSQNVLPIRITQNVHWKEGNKGYVLLNYFANQQHLSYVEHQAPRSSRERFVCDSMRARIMWMERGKNKNGQDLFSRQSRTSKRDSWVKDTNPRGCISGSLGKGTVRTTSKLWDLVQTCRQLRRQRRVSPLQPHIYRIS